MAAAPSAAEWAALNPYQQQAYLNGDPNYLSVVGPPAAGPPTSQQISEQLAGSDNFVTIPFGDSMETVWTLESYLSQWAAGAITFPASLGGADPVTEAIAIAADRCKVIPTPDCANRAALAAQYGGQVRAGIKIAPGVYAAPAPPAAAAPAVTPGATAPVSQGPATGAAGPTPAAPLTARTAPDLTPAPRGDAATYATTPGTKPTAKFVSGDVGGGIGVAVGETALSFIPFIGPILGALFGSLFGGTDLSGLQNAVNKLAQEIAQLGDELTRFTWKVANGLGELVRAIVDIWDHFIDALWSAIKAIWKTIWCVVSTVIPKIINVIRDLRKYLDWIYKNILRPMMNYLQKVRRILQILKVLHVPFAAKLDRILGQIQSQILGPFLLVLRWFNTYGSWINTVLAWDLTIQKPIFLRTMTKYQGEWINIWWNAQQGATAAGLNAGTVAGGAPPTREQAAAELGVWLKTPDGEFPVAINQAAADLDADLALS